MSLSCKREAHLVYSVVAFQLLKLTHEGLDILEFPVNGCKADVSDRIKGTDLLHRQLSDLACRDLLFHRGTHTSILLSGSLPRILCPADAQGGPALRSTGRSAVHFRYFPCCNRYSGSTRIAHILPLFQKDSPAAAEEIPHQGAPPLLCKYPLPVKAQ